MSRITRLRLSPKKAATDFSADTFVFSRIRSRYSSRRGTKSCAGVSLAASAHRLRNSEEPVLIIPCLPAFASVLARSHSSCSFKKADHFLPFRQFWLAVQRSWPWRGFSSFANRHRDNGLSALHSQSLGCSCCASRNRFCLRFESNRNSITRRSCPTLQWRTHLEQSTDEKSALDGIRQIFGRASPPIVEKHDSRFFVGHVLMNGDNVDLILQQ